MKKEAKNALTNTPIIDKGISINIIVLFFL